MKKLKFPSAVDVEYFKLKLQKLALKGKVVSGVKRYEMVVEKKAPSKMKYEIQPFNEETARMDGKSVSRDALIEINAEKGWNFIGENNRYMIFSAGDDVEDFKRIDPQGEYGVVKQMAKKEILGSLPTMLIVLAYLLFLFKVDFFSFTNATMNTFIAGPLLMFMSILLSGYSIIRNILFMLWNKGGENECIKYGSSSSCRMYSITIKGFIVAAVVIVSLLIFEGLIKLNTPLRIVMILSVVILGGGWTLLLKYRKNTEKLSIKVVLVIIGGAIAITGVTFFLLLWGLSTTAAETKMIEERTADMEYAMELEGFGIENRVEYSRVRNMSSVIIPHYYMYRESAGDFRIESEYGRFIATWAAKKYFSDYVDEEINRWDEFHVLTGDGEGYEYYSIIKSYETISVFRIGKEVFVYEYDSDLRKLGAEEVILKFLNEIRDGVLDI